MLAHNTHPRTTRTTLVKASDLTYSVRDHAHRVDLYQEKLQRCDILDIGENGSSTEQWNHCSLVRCCFSDVCSMKLTMDQIFDDAYAAAKWTQSSVDDCVRFLVKVRPAPALSSPRLSDPAELLELSFVHMLCHVNRETADLWDDRVVGLALCCYSGVG